MNSKMPSNRQLKMGAVVQSALVEIFLKEGILTAIGDASITVSEVRMSPDLKIATVYVIPLNRNIDQAEFISYMKSISSELRRMLGKKIKAKYLPELIFKFDNSFDNSMKINTILKSTEE